MSCRRFGSMKSLNGDIRVSILTPLSHRANTNELKNISGVRLLNVKKRIAWSTSIVSNKALGQVSKPLSARHQRKKFQKFSILFWKLAGFRRLLMTIFSQHRSDRLHFVHRGRLAVDV